MPTAPSPRAGPAAPVALARLPAGELELLRRAGRIARRLGYGLYLVGGPVRDLLLGRPSSDVDLMVEGDASTLAQALARELGGEVGTPSHFGTVKLRLPARVVDVATARTESYPHPGSLPVVAAASAVEDLCRRDFGINALAVDLVPGRFGRLLDPCGGLPDVQRRRLRVLHARSFHDDPLRLIRAVRLLCRLGLRLEPRTRRLAKEAIAAGALDTLSRRRLQDELTLFLEEPALACQVRRAQALGLLGALIPGITLDPGLLARLRCGVRGVDWLLRQPHHQPVERWLVVGLLLVAAAGEEAGLAAGHRLLPGKKAQHALVALTVDRERWLDLIRAQPTPSVLTTHLDALPAEAVLALACYLPPPLRSVLRRYLARWRHLRARLGGRDLLALGFTPSSRWREVLAELRAARLDGRARTRRDEVSLAVSLLAEQGLPSP